MWYGAKLMPRAYRTNQPPNLNSDDGDRLVGGCVKVLLFTFVT